MSDLPEGIPRLLGGRYAIKRELGRGGMAAVFLADDHKHDREVAVKIIHADVAAAIGGERFLREIRIEAHLRHPHIVPLLDSGTANGLAYYVMPYVEGESLRQRIAARGSLEVADAVRYWRDVVDAIAYAHRHNVLHRDIKPENVLVDERHASVVDFGVGKAIGSADKSETLTRFGLVVGTPVYMAPEQVTGSAELDRRTDIYALGTVAYEMLVGTPPFARLTPQAQVASKVSGPAPDIREVRPDVPVELARLIKRCLEPEPGDRWQSADDVLGALETIATPPGGMSARTWSRLTRTPRRRNITIGVIALGFTLVSGATYATVARSREARWAREVALPEIRRLADAATVDSAFLLAARARRARPDDPAIDTQWRRVSTTIDVRTQPEGARVSWTAYRGDTANWHPLGVSPLHSVSVPANRAAVTVLLKFEAPGRRTALRSLIIERESSTPVVLDTASAAIDDMVRVRGGVIALPSAQRVEGDSVELPDFLIDRFEVTNAQYEAFVASGGYRDSVFWDAAFASLDRRASRDSLLAVFRDKTGRPGPATWEGGAVPPGKEDYPVSGISWYEAMAYAKYAGKELPTIFHWRRAAQLTASSWILAHSNIEGSGLAPVGAFKGMTPYGVFDMAGNVREWCQNADGSRRYILGGGWSEQAHTFTHVVTVDPADRSSINGLRLMKRLDPGRSVAGDDPFGRPAPRGYRDYFTEKPVPDVVWKSFPSIFDYDHTPLQASVVSIDSSDTRWIREVVAFDAAYGQERMEAVLFLPRNARPPYQAVVVFPGANALSIRSSQGALTAFPDFIVSNGRAVLYPIYKDTYERGGAESAMMGTDPVYNLSGGLLGPNTYRDHVVMYVKDLRRSLDYLTTRADIDTARIAYLGSSWGSRIGPINLAVENRFKVAVLYLAGLNFAPRRPEVDEFNYLPHVKIPALILSGRYDDIFPLETSAKAYVRRLGTPSPMKRHEIYPTQHFLPREALIRETLDWLDRYLGRVH